MPTEDSIIPQSLLSPSAGFMNKAHDLDSQETLAEQNALGYLNQAMGSTKEMSVTQGIAAALLGVIPTIGGYLIGKSIGGVDYSSMPYTMDPAKLAPTGAAAGGIAGAEIGSNAVDAYSARLEAKRKQENATYEKLANLETKKADRLANEADQLRATGLKVDADVAMLPIELEQYRKQQEIARDAQVSAHIASRSYDAAHPLGGEATPSIFDLMSPEQKAAYVAKKAGISLDGKPVAESSRLSSLPVAAQNDLAESKALIDMAYATSSDIKTYKSWGELVAAKTASGLDPNAAMAGVQDLADRALRSRSGAAAPPAERAEVSKFVAGDITIPPAKVSMFLEKYAERERQFGISKLKAYETLSNPQTRSDLFADPLADKKRRQQELLSKAGQ